MANPLDGPGLIVAVLGVNAATGKYEAVTTTDVNGTPCLNVAVLAGGGGGGGATPSSTASQNVVAGSAASVTLLNANAARLDATFYNNQAGGGAASLYISLGSAASAANFAFRVPPNATFTLPIDYTGAVYGFWDNGATGNVAVTEFTP